MALVEESHVVSILPPIDINGAKSCDVFSMANYGHATIYITMGVTHSTGSVVTLEECDDFTPSNATAIAFSYYAEDTALGDTLGARTAADSAGFTTSVNNGIIYVIDIDAAALTDGYPCVQLEFADPGGSTIASAIVVLTEAKYQQEVTPTAIV